jgi:7,8-dihydro-6-hydroxymethylpterin dimethyltransferase
MKARDKDYFFHEATISLCSVCKSRISAKIIIKNNSVYLLKYCSKHGEQIELLEEDAEYFLKRRDYDKPGTLCKTQTKRERGCPFDCGLCPEHEQHTCIALIEVTNYCNLKCPNCYANSDKGNFLDLKKIEDMMDLFVDSEYGNPEILQISGGEPTTHPKIIEILELAESKKIKYVMLNTNGIRIAEDIEFVKKLGNLSPNFQVYLQFDGLEKSTSVELRGRDLSQIKIKAIENLAKFEIPITLVATIQKGVNDHEIGKIIDFGMKTKYVRGVNFQPIAFFGRLNEKVNLKDRITLTGILNRIEEQTSILKKSDFIPLPCNVERVAVTYLYNSCEGFIPITRNAKIKNYLPMIKNTFAFSTSDILKASAKGLLKGDVCPCLSFLKDFKEIAPIKFGLKSKKLKTDFLNDKTFRISVTSFVDVYNFDMKSMKKECVHILTPDLKMIPFSAYNIIHRERYLNK